MLTQDAASICPHSFNARSQGGAVFAAFSVAVDRCTFTLTSSGTTGGGAVASGLLGSGVTIAGSRFRGVSAAADGGAVSSGAPVVLRDGTSFSNVSTAAGRGGAVWTNTLLDVAQTDFADVRSPREARTLSPDASLGRVVRKIAVRCRTRTSVSCWKG